ncbi:probable ATP-dependent RNA helicase DHX34 [Contarinia nasturtii]|uniref:probable ATP-dependent RNA helicase DHX34 n=1 Tax=Contarinia nasturtii TaxID=265458 RepID=UPI0012D42633|nr:probable ATP-dependent RNA helicase DHX34 [Contarinia nasturtii]XP_031621595.1 probable ATP-dependent RNA helicase DHX34 [Contarinia nasturtii]
MSDHKKHKHKSKEMKKERDHDRSHQKRKRSRERRRSRSTERSRSKDRSRSNTDRNREHRNEKSYERGQNRDQSIPIKSKNDFRDYGHSSSYRSPTIRHEKNHSPMREKRSSSSSSLSPQRHTDDNQKEITNLVNFSFFDFKYELSKLLSGYVARDKLIEDVEDFWLFLQKYETTLRNSGKSILPDPIYDESVTVEKVEKNPQTGPTTAKPQNPSDCIKVKLAVPFDNLYGRLSSHGRKIPLSKYKVKQFLTIVLQYSDFLEHDRLMKLKKLRQTQADLPVAKFKDEIIEAVAREQVILVAGDTGCGKSTQIPQYLRQAGYESICCTQPRRIACISLSKRVAHEMQCEHSNEVGYQIRFERSKNKDTKIIFMTEGLLLRQLSTEAAITQFDVIVLDEVHERHLHGDFLLGVTKCLLKIRPELKLVLMSATINVKLFADYFIEEKVHVIEVPGRLFPIKLHYRPPIEDFGGRQSKADRLSPEPYVQIMQMIDGKYPSTEKGDLLIFMSGLTEITTIVDAATEYAEKNKNWIILPLHSSLSISDQDKVFDYPPDGVRKCIVSTNIAETSVTIDGVRFVVDSGKMKEMSYDPQTKMQRLKEFSISKASAKQRMGRAGRTGPGICYRLYAEKTYNEFEEYSQAEIHRVPLESLLLQMISMGLPDARMFPFIEPPAADSIENGILSLKKHDALTANEKVTPLGRALSKLPVEISIGKMLLMGCVFEQVQPVLTLAAALSVQTPFTNRAYRDHECETARKDLESDHGDPITVLNAYKEWLELKRGQFNRKNENTKQWCRRRGLEEQRFYEITKLRRQFEELLKDSDLLSVDNSEMSTSERIIRKGELRQLKQMRREHKQEAPKRRKLKMTLYSNENEDEDDGSVDIRDVDFRLSNDSSKIDDLVSGATACSYRDLIILKLILVSGLYPQVAISDEINHLKAPGQQFYHTEKKPYTSLHPMGFFANNPQILQLTQPEIAEPFGTYRSKLPLSSRHQLLCYLSLLETTKPYLMNTLRMPAAQTLLLFSHSIDTNSTFSKIICDSWLQLEFPQPECGQNLLLKASNLRLTWTKLLENKLESMTKSVESELATDKRQVESKKLENELWSNLATFMNSEILYTIKRLLPADLKTLYVGPMDDYSELLSQFKPNPFADDFECTPNDVKGGIQITDNILYAAVRETDWSCEMADLIVTTEWNCTHCGGTFYLTGIQKLQHTNECKPKPEIDDSNDQSGAMADNQQNSKPQNSNSKLYSCPNCKQELYLTSTEILKHRKTCT